MAEHLNLALVRSLRTLLEAGSFHAAAASLFITPPAITQQIRRLEEAVGYVIVDRTAVPLRLTERGERFMVHALAALDSSDRALGARDEEALRIGFINGYPRSRDEEFLVRFRERHPEIVVEFVQLNWGEQIAQVFSGAVDASLARGPYHADVGIDRRQVHSEPRVVAVPTGSALAARSVVSLNDLEELPIVRARGIDFNWTRYWVVDPRPSGRTVNYGIWAATMEEALSAVAMDGNIMITAESVSARYVHPGITYIPIAGLPDCTVELCTREEDRRPAIESLREASRGGN